jgi:hypothetical protein
VDSAVNLAEKLATFDERFAPRIFGYYNVELSEGELSSSLVASSTARLPTRRRTSF